MKHRRYSMENRVHIIQAEHEKGNLISIFKY
jgi:hypothetical protein